jgi:hypothetical protein
MPFQRSSGAGRSDIRGARGDPTRVGRLEHLHMSASHLFFDSVVGFRRELIAL